MFILQFTNIFPFFTQNVYYQLSYTYVHKWLKIFPPQNEEEEKLHPVLEGGGGSLAPLFSSPMMVSEVKKNQLIFITEGSSTFGNILL